MRFSSSTIEREFLASASAHVVLEYLDERGRELKGGALTTQDWVLSSETAAILLARKDRVVDIGLARVCDADLADTLLKRNTGTSGTPDDAVLEALFSNRLACVEFLGAPHWQVAQLDYAAKSGPLSLFAAMSENPSTAHHILDAALQGSGPFAGIDNKRRHQLLLAVLKHPEITKFREKELESYDYDILAHDTIGHVWMLLLREPVTTPNAWILLDRLRDLDSDLDAPSDKELAEFQGRTIESPTYKSQTLEFLKLVLPRWTSTDAKLEESPFGPLRQTIAAAVSQYDEAVKAFLLGHADSWVRRGAYERVSISKATELEAFFHKDGQHFLFGAAKNKSLILCSPDLAKAFYKLVSQRGTESPGEFELTASGVYERTFESLRKQYPGRLPRESYEWNTWTPDASIDEEDSTANESEAEWRVRLLKRLEALESKTNAIAADWKAWVILALVALVAWRLL